jgi:hypothetical protein
MKKKGDMARQLVADKDKEISILKGKLGRASFSDEGHVEPSHDRKQDPKSGLQISPQEAHSSSSDRTLIESSSGFSFHNTISTLSITPPASTSSSLSSFNSISGSNAGRAGRRSHSIGGGSHIFVSSPTNSVEVDHHDNASTSQKTNNRDDDKEEFEKIDLKSESKDIMDAVDSGDSEQAVNRLEILAKAQAVRSTSPSIPSRTSSANQIPGNRSLTDLEEENKTLRIRERSLEHTVRLVQTELAVHKARHSESITSGGSSEGSSHSIATSEREQRILYLRQAFCGFFKAKQGVEMQHLGRVICAILGLTAEETATVKEAIEKMTPAVVATSTLESFTSNFSSLFS